MRAGEMLRYRSVNKFERHREHIYIVLRRSEIIISQFILQRRAAVSYELHANTVYAYYYGRRLHSTRDIIYTRACVINLYAPKCHARSYDRGRIIIFHSKCVTIFVNSKRSGRRVKIKTLVLRLSQYI